MSCTHVHLSKDQQPVSLSGYRILIEIKKLSDILLSCSSCIETTSILCGQLNVRCTTLPTFGLDVLVILRIVTAKCGHISVALAYKSQDFLSGKRKSQDLSGDRTHTLTSPV